MRRPHRLFNIAVLAASVFGFSCGSEPAPPRLFRVPDTALISDRGTPVRLAEMNGYVTVYDFIFTNCAGTCPLMASTMRKLTERVDKDARVRFVSISVDPERDTPAVLSQYARKVRNDERWIFVTGKRDEIVRLSVEGFKLAAGGTPQTGAEPFLHSEKLAVVDRNGWIREYYGAMEPDAVEHVAKTVAALLRE
ncbi:MAG TPA: SCO family protein [Thermoanaerobaculia bacterium]|nr:SCO family protein [Thermoanaerobaculia bacterium]